jgi:hypothetical protein
LFKRRHSARAMVKCTETKLKIEPFFPHSPSDLHKVKSPSAGLSSERKIKKESMELFKVSHFVKTMPVNCEAKMEFKAESSAKSVAQPEEQMERLMRA